MANAEQLAGLERGRISSIETKQTRMKDRKDKFLERYEETGDFKGSAEYAEVKPMTVVTDWLQDDEEFQSSYRRLKSAWGFVYAEQEEMTLHRIGTGEIKTGKETGIGMPNVVAAKMRLAKERPNEWSEKVQTETKHTIEITQIEYRLTAGRQVEVIEGEVKELPNG